MPPSADGSRSVLRLCGTAPCRPGERCARRSCPKLVVTSVRVHLSVLPHDAGTWSLICHHLLHAVRRCLDVKHRLLTTEPRRAPSRPDRVPLQRSHDLVGRRPQHGEPARLDRGHEPTSEPRAAREGRPRHRALSARPTLAKPSGLHRSLPTHDARRRDPRDRTCPSQRAISRSSAPRRIAATALQRNCSPPRRSRRSGPACGPPAWLVDQLPRLVASGRQIRLMTGNAGIGRRPSAPQMSSAKASRTAGLVAVCLASAIASGGTARQALVGVQRDAPMPAGCKQGVAEVPADPPAEARPEARPIDSYAGPARLPPDCWPRTRSRRGPGAVIGKHHPGDLLEHCGIPERLCRHGQDCGPARMIKSCDERASQSKNGRQMASACCLVETLEHHREVENVAGPKGDLLAPMGIEQAPRGRRRSPGRSDGGRPSSEVALMVANTAPKNSAGRAFSA